MQWMRLCARGSVKKYRLVLPGGVEKKRRQQLLTGYCHREAPGAALQSLFVTQLHMRVRRWLEKKTGQHGASSGPKLFRFWLWSWLSAVCAGVENEQKRYSFTCYFAARHVGSLDGGNRKNSACCGGIQWLVYRRTTLRFRRLKIN